MVFDNNTYNFKEQEAQLFSLFFPNVKDKPNYSVKISQSEGEVTITITIEGKQIPSFNIKKSEFNNVMNIVKYINNIEDTDDKTKLLNILFAGYWVSKRIKSFQFK